MEPYAIIETGGKQYWTRVGDRLTVERLDAEAGAAVVISSVYAVSDGEKLKIGTPTVEGVEVCAEVVEHTRGPKVISFKKRRRKGYSRKIGQRQELTVLRVASIRS